jgi:hypothetical protein
LDLEQQQQAATMGQQQWQQKGQRRFRKRWEKKSRLVDEAWLQ